MALSLTEAISLDFLLFSGRELDDPRKAGTLSMRKKISLLYALIFILTTLSTCSFPDVEITVVNNTETTLTGLHSKFQNEDWGTNLLAGDIPPTQQQIIYLTKGIYDFMITYDELGSVFLSGVDLLNLDIYTLTAKQEQL